MDQQRHQPRWQYPHQHRRHDPLDSGAAIRGFIPNGAGNQRGTFDNQGTILQPAGYFYLYDSVTLQNDGLYDSTGDTSILYGNNSPSIVNTHTGTFEKTGGTGTTTISVLFNNQAGAVNATSGTLSLVGGTSSANGNFNAQAGGAVSLGGVASGTYAWHQAPGGVGAESPRWLPPSSGWRRHF